MRPFLLLSLLSFFSSGPAGAQSFPADWQGKWQGELLWYQGVNEPRKVPMQLNIQPTDSGYTWQLSYGEAQNDHRPYSLLPRDTSKGYWVIDEHNGIIIDMYLVGGRLHGAFTVNNVTIVNNYRLEGDTLVAEFYTLSAKPSSTSGEGTEESPTVSSYKVSGFQSAKLSRISQ